MEEQLNMEMLSVCPPLPVSFWRRHITSESVCTRRICPQNEINEIMSVPERFPTVIQLGGCGRLDELIDRSVEAAAGEYWCRRAATTLLSQRDSYALRTEISHQMSCPQLMWYQSMWVNLRTLPPHSEASVLFVVIRLSWGRVTCERRR